MTCACISLRWAAPTTIARRPKNPGTRQRTPIFLTIRRHGLSLPRIGYSWRLMRTASLAKPLHLKPERHAQQRLFGFVPYLIRDDPDYGAGQDELGHFG